MHMNARWSGVGGLWVAHCWPSDGGESRHHATSYDACHHPWSMDLREYPGVNSTVEAMEDVPMLRDVGRKLYAREARWWATLPDDGALTDSAPLS